MSNARPAIPPQIPAGRLMPVMRGFAPARAVEAARAMVAGGLRVVELTCDRPDAIEAIAAVRAALPPEVAVGAGTVLDQATAALAHHAGAGFMVHPHTDPALVRWCADHGIPSLPGALTPSEVLAAWNAGAAAVKAFPVGQLGTSWFSAMRAPLRHIPLMAVGGIAVADAPAWIRAGAIAVGLGESLCGRADAAVDARVLQQRTAALLAALTSA